MAARSQVNIGVEKTNTTSDEKYERQNHKKDKHNNA